MSFAPYEFERSGRNHTTVIVLTTVWSVCWLAVWKFDASLIFIGLVLMCTIPALWDVVSNTRAGVRLNETTFFWYSGKACADVNLDEIDMVQFMTRLDLTVRVVVVLKTGKKVRLPPESTPPHKALQARLASLDVKTERHHFSLM